MDHLRHQQKTNINGSMKSPKIDKTLPVTPLKNNHFLPKYKKNPENGLFGAHFIPKVQQAALWPQQQTIKQKIINVKKNKLTNGKERCPLAEKNPPEANLGVAAKWWKSNDWHCNNKDAKIGKRALQNGNIQKVTHKVWKSPIYKRPKP